MLREIHRVSQRSVERRKRWFQDEYFDLYIWQIASGDVVELQLCYARGTSKERALSWRRGAGYDHALVESGRSEGEAMQASQLMRSGGKFGGWQVRERLAGGVGSLEPELSAFILDKVKDYCDPPHRFRRPGRVAPDWLRRLKRRAPL